MKLDLNNFDLPSLMAALGAGQSALETIADDPELANVFKQTTLAWAEQLAALSKAIAAAHNGGQ